MPNKLLSTQSIKCYPKTNVLINKLNIKDAELLEIAERRISVLKLAKMHMEGIPNTKFDISIDYLFQIHKFIFEDIYEFAGIIRTENIIKDNTLFCPVEYISNTLYKLLEKMKKDIYKIKTRDELVVFLAYYYGELNIIHPFREGNGRTIREFLYQLVKEYNRINLTNYDLDYSLVDEELKKILINGSIENANTAKINLLRNFFDKTLQEKEKIKEVIK